MIDNPYTLRITLEGHASDRVEFVTGAHEDVIASCHVAHYDGAILWASDWDFVREMSRGDLGLVARCEGPAETYRLL